MKIKHFMLSLNPKYGGPTYSVPIQCRGLAKEDVDTTLVTYTESRPWEKEIVSDGVKIVEYNKPICFIRKKLHLALRNLLKKDDNADIYHYHGIWLPCNHWCAVAARQKGKKYVVNPRGDLEIYRINYNKWKKLKKKIIWHLYAKRDTQKASCIIATSQQECDAIRQLGITAPIAIIPNGIEMTNFPNEVVHHHGEKKVMLFLSRVNPIKGVDYLIDAWAQLPERLQSEWELHIAGNSDPQEYIHTLERKVKVMNLSNSIKFLGPIIGEAKMRKYQDSNLFILPTLNENFGNVVAEAMMCECPVITTTNAPWSCLSEDKCGWWIELSVENLVNTLNEAMTLRDDERHELGRLSRQSIIKRYSAESVAKKTIAVYRWILGQGDKPEFVYTV